MRKNPSITITLTFMSYHNSNIGYINNKNNNINVEERI